MTTQTGAVPAAGRLVGIAYREPRSVPPVRLAGRVAATTRAFYAVRRGGPATVTAWPRQPAHDIFRRDGFKSGCTIERS
jgi:hypothetical protein